MFDQILNIFRKGKLKKFASDVPTSLLKLSEIKTANVVIDVEEAGFDQLKEDILLWGRNNGIKVNIYFFDFRKLGANELLLTSIQTTVIKKELNWFGMPPIEKVAPLLSEYEQEIYQNYQRELAEMREKQGERVVLWPVEVE